MKHDETIALLNTKYAAKMPDNKFLIQNISLIRLSHDEIVINSAKFRAKHR